MSRDYKCRCEDCAALLACKYTFGRYWRDKSADGTGCNVPINTERRYLDEVARAAIATRRQPAHSPTAEHWARIYERAPASQRNAYELPLAY